MTTSIIDSVTKRRGSYARSSIVLFASALVLLGCQKKEGPKLPPAEGAGAPPPAKITTLGDVAASAPKSTVSAEGRASTGSLRPKHEVALGPKETGVLSAISVEEGDRVKQGQLLFRLDAAQALLGVEQAKASLTAATLQRDAAKLDFDRVKALRDRGSVAPDVYDQAETRLRAAETAVQQANVAVTQVQRRNSDLAVYSPIDGVVTEKRMSVGEIATMMPPSVVMVIQDVDVLELRARLPEGALKSLREGSEITVKFPSIDELRTVKITRIAPTVDARTRTIEIIADIDNRDHRLLAGMLAEVSYSGTQLAEAPGAAAESKKP